MRKGMYTSKAPRPYRLCQSGRLAYKNLKQHLKKYGYHQVKQTHGLWKHKTRKTIFTRVVDDFQVCYFSKEDVDHLLGAIEDPLKTDWAGAKYIRIDFNWNYEKGEVILSMKVYIERALKELQFRQQKTTYGPTLYTASEHGKQIQYTIQDLSPTLDKETIKFIHKVCGKFLYCRQTVNSTMQHALNDLCTAATVGTE